MPICALAFSACCTTRYIPQKLLIFIELCRDILSFSKYKVNQRLKIVETRKMRAFYKHALIAFEEMVLNRRKPNFDEYEMLAILRKRDLKNTADFLHSLL